MWNKKRPVSSRHTTGSISFHSGGSTIQLVLDLTKNRKFKNTYGNNIDEKRIKCLMYYLEWLTKGQEQTKRVRVGLIYVPI